MAQREVRPEEVAAAKAESARGRMPAAGFLYVRVLRDGRCLYLAPAASDPKTILLGISRNVAVHSYYGVWEYAQDDAMWRAVLGWDGNGAPEGFRFCLMHPNKPAGEA